jgi:DNA-binding response OmpR family regulator
VVRRASAALGETLTVGPLSIDVPGRVVRQGGETVDITGLAFDILVALARRAGRVVSRELLLQEVGRGQTVVGDRTVDVHISHLRQKLGDDPREPRLIKTVRGAGYVLAKGS